MIKKHIIFILVIFFTGCSTPEIITSFNTVNLNNTKAYINYRNPLVYYLPRNKIIIDVEVSKKSFIAGPFSEFAEKYLQISGVKMNDFTEYIINNVDVETIAVPDTNQIYIIENENFGKHINFIDLTASGIIKSINKKSDYLPVKDIKFPFPTENDEMSDITFTDLTIKANIEEKTERTYKQVKTDTGFIRVPVTRKIKVEKTVEEKAEEAAAFIFKLRKRRFKVMAGMYETHPDGLAVLNMVKELDELEDEYLSLFIGKSYESVYHYQFEFDPQPEIDYNREILFKFSNKKGIIEKRETSRLNIISGIPVIINVTPLTQSQILDDFFFLQNNKFKDNKGFHFREPSLVRIEIIHDLNTIFLDEILLAQYGQILALPIDLFREENVEVEFYEEYGSLKNISKKTD